MKTKIIASFFMVVLFGTCLNAATKEKLQQEKSKVDVYYFHFNSRCATCRAIESESKADVMELFGNDVSFAAYNLDEKAGEVKGKELGVDSQALVVVQGDTKIDLTNEGFLYALTDPDKFKEIIEEKIKSLL